MFIYTAKLHRKRILFGLIALVLVCGLLLTLAGTYNLWGTQTVVNPTAETSEKVKTNEDRIAYLESFGWALTPEPLAVEELSIPEVFDDTLTDYLALQDSQGFDLSQFAGKTVKRYTYGITNYPTGDDTIMVSILVYKNHVIGGEVFSSTTGELLHGLSRNG
jgi:hypothetical protein